MSCARGCCSSAAEHFRSVAVAPRAREVGSGHQREEALAYDMASYRAMRAQGLQPPKIPGCYDLARRSVSEAEIRLGQVIDEKDPARKRKGARLMENMLEISDHCMVPGPPSKGAKKRKVMKR